MKLVPEVTLKELLLAFQEVMRRAELFSHHHVQREPLSVRERMTQVLESLQGGGHVEFTALFRPEEGRTGVVVTFLAVLELVKEQLVRLSQNEPFAPIYVAAA